MTTPRKTTGSSVLDRLTTDSSQKVLTPIKEKVRHKEIKVDLQWGSAIRPEGLLDTKGSVVVAESAGMSSGRSTVLARSSINFHVDNCKMSDPASNKLNQSDKYQPEKSNMKTVSTKSQTALRNVDEFQESGRFEQSTPGVRNKDTKRS